MRASRSFETVTLVFLAGFLLAACDETEAALVRIVPGQLPLHDINSIAVASFGGTGGEDIASLVDSQLREHGCFEVKNRRDVVRFMAQTEGSLVDAASARHAAAELGVDVVLYGNVETNTHRAELQHTPVVVNHQVYNPATGRVESSSEITHWKVERKSRLLVRCRVKTAGVGDGFEAGEVVAEKTVESFAHAETPWSFVALFDPQSILPAEDVESTRNNIYPWVADAIMREAGPHQQEEPVKVYHTRRVPQSASAAEAAVNGDWATALPLYEAGAREADTRHIAAKYAARAYYNLGIALAAVGRFGDAVAALETAESRKGDDRHGAMLDKMRRWREEASLARAQLASMSCR